MYCSCLTIILTILANSFTTIAFSNNGNGNGTPDHLALLAFQRKINNDPSQALSSWNDSIHYCNWNGITCSRRHRDRVILLNLQSKMLEGTLSPHIGNLSFLQEIMLDDNEFHGPIPQEIGRLSRLKVLSLPINSFSDEIPTNLTYCSKLRVVNLTGNHLTGGIPIQLSSLLKLTRLHLSSNKLEGRIPSMLGNLTALTHFKISYNNFIGSIPEDLCHIQSLERFSVGSNELSGKVPSCLYNLSHIIVFSIAFNQLDGILPSDIGLTLPNLKTFFVGGNKLKGLIPLSFPNASRLKWLEIEENQFIGHVPRNLGMLQDLRYLMLSSNQLVDDLQFITSLANCTNLEYLEVAENALKGPMPNSIGNLSTKLTGLGLYANQIYGSIPASIGDLVNLNILDISYNNLIGDISKVIGVFHQIVRLFLENNEFSGQIPDSFNHNSTQLTMLYLDGNKLHGNIPPSLGKCQSLSQLYLYDNRLSGTIPNQILSLSSVIINIDLSNNALSGPLPSEVGNLTKLVQFDLSNNKISGSIPTTLGYCLTLEYLSISQNLFTGSIPQSLSALKGLHELNLSRNKLSGEIPPYLENFTSLFQLDLSYNDLEGSVPKVGVYVNATAVSLVGNSKLCGGVAELKLPPCQNLKARKSQFLKVVILVIVVSICLVVLLCLIFVCYRKRVSKAKPSSESLFINQFTRITYAELLEATNRFSIENLIGIGSFGSVYKAILSQTIVAVKVINLQQQGAFKSFLSECNALKNLRHRNLLKIITACSGVDFRGNDFKALVFEFMPNGSLEEWLHPKRNIQDELKNVNFLQRMNIAIDVASALDYLHNHCQLTIVHCDLKPSNVLLDDEMVAHVADFGLAKIFSSDTCNFSQKESSSLAIKGSIGYVAPEYGMGGEVSMQGDVYSYGILLLELFTGKKPTNDMFQSNQNLHGFAKAALPERVASIVDPSLLLESTSEAVNTANQSNRGTKLQKCLVSVIRLGVACSSESPVERMKIGEVITEMHHIRDHYEGVRIHRE